ncbi:MAG: serine/threonine-protein kinase [Planctomycetota bacterium]|nr:serine/threonine-protein kinase [Planctomycetota bacterium]
MSEPTPAEIAVDAYVDLLLRGSAPSLGEYVELHPELGPAERTRLEKLARTLGRGPATAATVGALPFETLGPYRLIARLGAGGMGIVYEAEDVRLGRRVALKVVRPELAGSADTIARFEREARAVAKLRHPSIVTVYEAGSDHGVPYLAMEFVRGSSLDEIYAEARRAHGRTPTKDLLRWTRDTARALAAAHAAGIVHRDVKPSNVRITPEGQALLLDFGLALDPDSASISRSGQLHGTLYYVSPEQVAGNATRVDARTDVWSLGVMLYEGLTGRVPFEGQHSQEILYRILSSEPVAPRALAPELSRDLETVVLTALEKDRERRYASAAAFADDLDALLEGRPIHARPSGVITKAWKWSRRRPAHATAAVLAFALVVGGPALYALVQQRNAQALGAEKRVAVEQRELAEARARDLEQLSLFQGRVLTRVEPKQIGLHVLDELRREASLAWANEPGADAAANARDFERILGGANLANVAVNALQRDVLEPAIDAAQVEFGDRPRVHGTLLHSIADTCWTLGLPELALSTEERALEILRGVARDDDRDVLSARANFGWYLYSTGKAEEAEPHLRAAATDFPRVAGPDDPKSLGARQNWALFLRAAGSDDEAEAMLVDVLERRRRVLGDEHPDTQGSVANLGAMYVARNRRAEAMPLLAEAYSFRRRTLGPGAEATLSTANNLGILYRDSGRLADAEIVLQDASEAASEHLGDRHPLTGFLLGSWAEVLVESGCPDWAEPVFHRSIDASTQAVGAHHANTLYSVAKLGSLLRRAGRYTEAEQVLGDTFRAASAELGETHADVRLLAAQWAALLIDEGRGGEAATLIARLRDAARSAVGPTHERTQRYTGDLARTLASGGAIDEAVEEVEDTLVRLPAGRKPSRALVDAAVTVYEARERASPSSANAEAITRWRALQP